MSTVRKLPPSVPAHHFLPPSSTTHPFLPPTPPSSTTQPTLFYTRPTPPSSTHSTTYSILIYPPPTHPNDPQAQTWFHVQRNFSLWDPPYSSMLCYYIEIGSGDTESCCTLPPVSHCNIYIYTTHAYTHTHLHTHTPTHTPTHTHTLYVAVPAFICFLSLLSCFYVNYPAQDRPAPCDTWRCIMHALDKRCTGVHMLRGRQGGLRWSFVEFAVRTRNLIRVMFLKSCYYPPPPSPFQWSYSNVCVYGRVFVFICICRSQGP